MIGRIKSTAFWFSRSASKKFRRTGALCRNVHKAHARRRFFEAQQEHPRMAKPALRLIGRMYLRVRVCDEQQLSPAERAKARAEPEGLSRTMVNLKRIALRARLQMLPKSTLGKACDYLLRHWAPLSAHLDHGERRLDNNLVDDAIRPSRLGKKNWLFIGHPDASQSSAIIYPLIVSCQRHGKDPMAYVRINLARLPRMTNRENLRALTPRLWQSAIAQSDFFGNHCEHRRDHDCDPTSRNDQVLTPRDPAGSFGNI